MLYSPLVRYLQAAAHDFAHHPFASPVDQFGRRLNVIAACAYIVVARNAAAPVPKSSVEPLRNQIRVTIVFQHELLHIPSPASFAPIFIPEERVRVNKSHQHGIGARLPKQAFMQGGKELVEIVMPSRTAGVHRLAAALRIG